MHDSFVLIAEPVFLLLMAGVALIATLRLVPKAEGPGRFDLIVFLWSSIWWSGCSLAENLPISPQARLVFGNLAWLGITITPLSACFLLWSSSFGNRRRVSAPWRLAMILSGIAVCLVAFLNPWQSMYAQIIAAPDNIGPLQYIHGAFFFWVVGLIYIVVLVTMLVTAWAQIRLPRRRRMTHAGIILGISVPLITSGFYATGSLVVFGYDPTPFTFLFTAPLLAWLLAFNGLCDPLPIARRTLLEVLNDAVIILDDDRRIVELNQPARRLPGMPPQTVGVLVSALGEWGEYLGRAIRDPQKNVRIELPGDPPRYFELTATALQESAMLAGYLVFLRDVTLRQETENRLNAALAAQNVQLAKNRRLQAELHDEARIDPLTGAHNRRSLEEALPVILEAARRSRRPVSVAMIDLDHFKSINDAHGHVFGDFVLKAFAKNLSAMARKDDLLFRMGGEEFLFVLPNTDQPDAVALLECWLAGLNAGLSVEGKQLFLSFSAGVNTIPTSESDPARLVAHADRATYVAKRRGRNRVVSYEAGLQMPTAPDPVE